MGPKTPGPLTIKPPYHFTIKSGSERMVLQECGIATTPPEPSLPFALPPYSPTSISTCPFPLNFSPSSPEKKKARQERREVDMWRPMRKGVEDLEAGGGARPLYPMMLESPELRWAFIRKVYSILSFQLLVTVAVCALVVFVHPIQRFFTTTSEGLGLYIFIIILPFISLCPLFYYHQKHPINFILLGIFTLGISFAIGLTCAFTSGKVILEAALLTAAVVVSLTVYTFWAARRGQDFSFLGPFLFASLIALIVFAVIQIFFPMGKITTMIYGCIAALIFAGYIVYDTDNLIKRYTYDEYIWAAISLYLDIINLFQMLLLVFRASET